MRILLLTGQMHNGGAETHVYELARALTRRGHEVTVASSGGRLARMLEGDGVRHLSLPLDRKSPTAFAKSFSGLMRLTEEWEFDIVHAHSRIAALVASWICQRRGLRLVTTIHAHFSTNRLLHGLSRWGSTVIAVSHDLYSYLLAYGQNIPVERIHVIPNGVDTDIFCPASDKPSDKLKISFLSRLDGDCSEAAYALCRISHELAARYGDVEIVIGGGGDALEDIKRTAEEINKQEGRELIRTVGEVADTVTFFQCSDAFVGVSRAALEAMSCAVPTVLAGNEGFLGVAEGDALERGEQTNFCCRGCGEIKDRALLQALCNILDRTLEQRQALGKEHREYVLRYHSIDATCAMTEKVYRSSINTWTNGGGGVLLCGYYGYGNMGDDMLLLGAIERARKSFKGVPICALTEKGRKDGRRFGIRCARRSRILTVIRELRRADTVVFGGGTLLQNTTSRRSLGYYLFLLRYAQSKGKRVELWGNGVDNVSGEAWRYRTATALSRCHYVGLRDRASLLRVNELISQYGLKLPPTVVEPDLAMREISEERGRVEHILDRLGVARDRKTAVVALRGVEKKGYVVALEKWVRALAAEGIMPIFVVMYPRQDLEMCKRLAYDCGGVLAYPISPSDVMALMRRSSIVCGMRYHALVFAYSVGVPFVGFGAEPKIQSFCNSHGGVYFTELF